MKNIIIVMLVGFSFTLIGQETKKIINKLSSNEKEIYYVLQTDKSIKHGKYKLFYRNKLKLSGTYSNNQKNGLWTMYSDNGNIKWEGAYKGGLKNGLWTTFLKDKTIETKGEYRDDKRIGIWNFYNRKGMLVQQYDFEENKLTIIDTTELKPLIIDKGGLYDGLVYIDSMPTYIYGEPALYKLLADNIYYPLKAKEKGIVGKVLIYLYIDKKGQLYDLALHQGIGGGCDEEAIRVLKLTSGNWNAATFNGCKVGVKVLFPLVFVLE